MLEIYTKTEETMKKLAKKEINQNDVLLHALAISFVMNLGAGLITGDVVAGLFVTIPLTVFTFFSILAIEYGVFFTAKKMGGKGDYWHQLSITNSYLAPIFVVFGIGLGILSWILPENLSLGFDAIGLIIILFMNPIKMRVVHDMNTLWTTVVYFVMVVMAYVLWIALFFLALLLPIAVGL